MSRVLSTGMREGGKVLLAVWAVAMLAVLPGRWVLSGIEARDVPARLGALLAGAAMDGTLLVVPCMVLAALCMTAGRRRRWVGRGMAVLVALGAHNAMVSMAESRLSRGVFPSWVDVAIMGRSPAMMSGSLDMFLLPRNVLPALLMLPATALLIGVWPRALAGSRRLPRFAGALAAGLVLLLATRLTLAALGGLGGGVDSPLALLSARQLPELVACASGPCEPAIVLQQGASDSASIDRGAAMLGWPPLAPCHQSPAHHGHHMTRSAARSDTAPATSGDCDDAQAGDTPLFRRAMPSVESIRTQRYAAQPLLADMAALSASLRSDVDEPVHIWQIALEGVRADDVHALNPAAPRELTPFLTSLYEQAAAHAGGLLASRRTWTAGVRTPHGISALLCGLGTLPHGLALSRDLPGTKLRCLPDVLADAGLTLSYGYGGSVAFDRMGAFLSSHRLPPLLDPAMMASDLPRSAWGLSDRVLFDAIARAPAQLRSSYTFVLSLSHHHPFVVPPDLPAAVRARAERAFTLADPQAGQADRRRLLTLAYTDAAIEELFDKLARSKMLDRSIIVISADHAIPERALWRHRPGALKPHQSRALIPFVVRIPPVLLAGAAEPKRARRAFISAAGHWEQTQLSQNDIPTVLLALLEQLGPLRQLAPEQRWHSMGGQATSPWYRPPGPPSTALHGIHAATALYSLDSEGQPNTPDEPAALVITPELAAALTPRLRPELAALRLAAQSAK